MILPLHQRPAQWKTQPRTLEGRRVIVTGGTTGIGRTTALLLASQGAHVVIFGRDRKHLDQALGDLADYEDRVHGLTADQAVEGDIDRVFDFADQQLGGLDALVNNAALPARSIEQQDPDNYRYVIETNVLGYMSCAKRAVPRLRESGGGHLVNVGSLSAKSPDAGEAVYAASKAALRAFSESLGKSLAEEEIAVSLIEYGNVGSDLGGKTDRQRELQKAEQGTMLFSEPAAEAIVYCLTQPQHSRVTLLQLQPLKQSV